MEGELEFAKGLALEAGKVMLEHFRIGVASESKADEGNTPVTIADKTINSMVIRAVKEKYPSHRIIGEEESYGDENTDFAWVCDPIDGTIPYTMGVPTNVFSIALVNKEGAPVVAVVYDPYMKRLYSAVKGRGASINEEKLQVNQVKFLKEAVLGLSGGRSRVLKTGEFKSDAIANCFRPVILSCVVYEAMLVAAGQLTGAVFAGAGCWDAASAKLIVEEAGGRVTDLYGNEQRYDRPLQGAVMSNGLIHDELLAVVSKHRIQ